MQTARISKPGNVFAKRHMKRYFSWKTSHDQFGSRSIALAISQPQLLMTRFLENELEPRIPLG